VTNSNVIRQAKILEDTVSTALFSTACDQITFPHFAEVPEKRGWNLNA